MTDSTPFPVSSPLRVGLVGTGYAARLRADALESDGRAILVGVAGHTPEKTQEFGHLHQAQAFNSWQELIQMPELDLVIVSNINQDHGAIVRATLEAGRHVVVEYPLTLDVTEGEALVDLARQQGCLLHVEHIELLGGVHRALHRTLGLIGRPFYARYATVNPQRPAPQKWTYHPTLFGFPLMGALSRLHRLVDVFGRVVSVSCQAEFLQRQDDPHYHTCLCNAQLRFENGVFADVVYGKGEAVWQTERKLEVYGEKGGLVFDGDEGQVIREGETSPIEVGSRRGLFARDMSMVLDHLLEGKALYITPEESLYTLKVADAARRSAETGQTVSLTVS